MNLESSQKEQQTHTCLCPLDPNKVLLSLSVIDIKEHLGTVLADFAFDRQSAFWPSDCCVHRYAMYTTLIFNWVLVLQIT